MQFIKSNFAKILTITLVVTILFNTIMPTRIMAVDAIIGEIQNKLESIADPVIDKIEDAKDTLVDEIQDELEGTVEPVVEGITDKLQGTAETIGEEVVGHITEGIQETLESVGFDWKELLIDAGMAIITKGGSIVLEGLHVLGLGVVMIIDWCLGMLLNGYSVSIELISAMANAMTGDEQGYLEDYLEMFKDVFVGPDNIFSGDVVLLKANIFQLLNGTEDTQEDEFIESYFTAFNNARRIEIELAKEIAELNIEIVKENISNADVKEKIQNLIEEITLLEGDINNVVTTGSDPQDLVTIVNDSKGIVSIAKEGLIKLDRDLARDTATAKEQIEGLIEIFEGTKADITEHYEYLRENIIDKLHGITPDGHIMTQAGKAVAQTYLLLRNICALLMLAGLIFTGIKILLSANSPTTQSQYLALLQEWLVGMALLIFSHLIMIFIFWVSDTLVEFLKQSLFGGVGSMNINLALTSFYSTDVAARWISLVMYAYMVWLTVVFAVAYFKRFFFICILTVFAPVFSVMCVFGKQSKSLYSKWLKEYIVTVFIQPYHLIVYSVLVSIPMNIVNGRTGVLDVAYDIFQVIYVLIAMTFIRPSEKYLRGIFGMDQGAAKVASYDSGKQTIDAIKTAIVTAVKTAVKTAKDVAKGSTEAVETAVVGAAIGTLVGGPAGTVAGGTAGVVAGEGAIIATEATTIAAETTATVATEATTVAAEATSTVATEATAVATETTAEVATEGTATVAEGMPDMALNDGMPENDGMMQNDNFRIKNPNASNGGGDLNASSSGGNSGNLNIDGANVTMNNSNVVGEDIFDLFSGAYEGLHSITDTFYVDSAPQDWRKTLGDARVIKDVVSKKDPDAKFEKFNKDLKNLDYINKNYKTKANSVSEAIPNAKLYFNSGYTDVKNMKWINDMASKFNISPEYAIKIDQAIRQNGEKINYNGDNQEVKKIVEQINKYYHK